MTPKEEAVTAIYANHDLSTSVNGDPMETQALCLANSKGMNAARQISRRFGRAAGARTRFAVDYYVTATTSIKSDPLAPEIGRMLGSMLKKYGNIRCSTSTSSSTNQQV